MKTKKKDIKNRTILIAGFAVGGATATLIYTFVWMIWYEKTTGYSAGNAPVAWIFFFGPLGAAIGALIGFLVWWLKTLFSNGDNDA